MLNIQTSADEYIVSGIKARLKFESGNPSKNICIGQVCEGKFEGKQWVTSCMTNGDETCYNGRIIVTRRKAMISPNLKGQIVPP